jgi:hypothetical protein
MSLACSYGQSVQVFYNDSLVKTMDTITIDVIKSGSHYFDLVNISEQSINLMIRRRVIDIMPDVITSFCFDVCYDPDINLLRRSYLFKAGDTCTFANEGEPSFYVDYDPKNQKGISIIQFEFYNKDSTSDKNIIVLKFNSISLGIADKQTAKISINAYPNPATTKVFIQHDLKNQVSKARLFVSNIMGTTVKSIPINSTSDKTQIDVSDLAPGIYFYSIEINGRISATKKLIIK